MIPEQIEILVNSELSINHFSILSSNIISCGYTQPGCVDMVYGSYHANVPIISPGEQNKRIIWEFKRNESKLYKVVKLSLNDNLLRAILNDGKDISQFVISQKKIDLAGDFRWEDFPIANYANMSRRKTD